MIIDPPALDEPSEAVARLYQADVDADGYVHRYTQAMALNPQAQDAFVSLVKAVVASIGIGVYEAATLGAARAIGSPHCLLAHGHKSLKAGVLDEAGLLGFAQDEDDGFDERLQAVVRYAAKLSTDARSMTDADSERLRQYGFDDRQILDITLAASLRNHYSRALLALAVPLDDEPLLPPALASAMLTRAGRG
ncbi:alkylhydroperoxidase family enzyme [Microbacterium sp. W4I4]|uniref:carboxymuconolactone decarboxylase family protein n=1 Tax=Microbacterium sp. W4I4 TaxID=3042295 RepID=UPI00277EB5E5|nr:carboxymuconolactone decarboxylase family protein [Microbacterium sp. W4I4]MDQ0613411.1 alkylhydroperoxidase family enzyme [Microbacterium sp. W4I4]